MSALVTHRRRASLARALPLLLAALAPVAARADVVEESTRIAVAAGWRYTPNARFRELAASHGYPAQGRFDGGPQLVGIFGYRVQPRLEVALELGWNSERYGFLGVPALQVSQVPLLATARFAPLSGRWAPYLGAGYGYFLNFMSGGPLADLESHASGVLLLAGATIDLSERIALLAEYRLGFCRATIPGLGAVQVGGNSLVVGAHLTFDPEMNRLE